jgi:CHAD domain-containing protein
VTATRRHHPGIRFQSMLRRGRRSLAPELDVHERVHAARVALKEVRAVLRLLRRELPEEVAAGWNQRLRQAMKELAPARDQLVMSAVLRAHAGRLPREEDRRRLVRALPRPPAIPSRALRRIDPLLEELGQSLTPVLKNLGWKPVERAFAKSLRTVRRLQTRAGREQTPALWHRWRRRVKELAYQADFVRPPDLPGWRSLRQDAWDLQSKLGDLQDLHVTLDALPHLEVPADVRKALRAILRRAADNARRRAWKARLRKKALGGSCD